MAYHEHYGSCGECGIELSDPANVDVSELAKLLTTNAALTAKLAVATEALTAIRDASTWAKSWDHTSHLNNKARVALAKIQEVD